VHRLQLGATSGMDTRGRNQIGAFEDGVNVFVQSLAGTAERAGVRRSSGSKGVEGAHVDANQLIGSDADEIGERAIDAYARSIALSDPKNAAAGTGSSQLTPEFRSTVLEQLTALYKDLHNNSDAGLSELIAGGLLQPLP